MKYDSVNVNVISRPHSLLIVKLVRSCQMNKIDFIKKQTERLMQAVHKTNHNRIDLHKFFVHYTYLSERLMIAKQIIANRLEKTLIF